MIFLIATINDLIRNPGYFYWGSKYINLIKPYLPDDLSLLKSIQTAFLYFIKADRKLNNVIQLKITTVQADNYSLKIYYEIEKTLDYKSFQIREVLKKLLNLKSIHEIPFCCAINQIELLDALNDAKLITTVSLLEEQNNWQDIYNLLRQFLPIENHFIWNDAELLNKFSFATAKLSECTENLKKKFQDKSERKKFIKEKRYFRELTIKLRKRIIELEPNNAAYYSNLAYTYYQSVNELTKPNSRKDGNIIEDTENAIKYIDLALKYNPNRITDLYRKAMLISNIYGKYIFFNNYSDEQFQEKLTAYTDAIKESILNFQKIETIYESFTIEEQKNRCKKIYIKTLYNLAQKFLTLARTNINLYSLIFIDKEDLLNEQKAKDTINYLQLANKYIDKCIKEDYNKKKIETEIEALVECNNFSIAVYKSYLKGIINLYLYAITDKNEYESEAKKFLYIANEINFPLEMQNQNKLFILEKLALLSLIKKNYEQPIKMLEPIYQKKYNFPAYAAYTLAISFVHKNETTKANEIIEKYIEESNQLFKVKFQRLKEYLLTRDKKIIYETNKQDWLEEEIESNNIQYE